jgi:DNA-binding GntR family transcriptional regulator
VIEEHRLLMEAVLSRNGDRAHAAARSYFGLSLSILEAEVQSRPALESAGTGKGPRLRAQ